MPTRKKKTGKEDAAKRKRATGKVVSKAQEAVVLEAGGKAYVKAEPEAMKSNRFTEEEDTFICRAFVNCTTDATIGANQKGDDFWKKVHKKFYAIYNEEAEVAVDAKWSWESVRNRFQKTIAKTIQKYNVYFKQVKEKEKSGWTPQMYIDQACKVWYEMEGKPFKFSGCVRILHQVPKYNPMLFDNDSEDDGDKKPKARTYNDVSRTQGDMMVRPMGSKKAKKLQMQEKIEAGSMQSSAALETVAASSGRMAAAIEKRQRHDSWSKRADLYLRMGNMEKATEMLAMMEKDDARVASLPEAIEVNDERETSSTEDDKEADGDDEDEESDHPSQPSDDSLPVKRPRNIEEL